MDYKRVLVLHFTNGMSSREIAETTGDGKTTINEFLKRFRDCGVLSYPLPEDVTNEFIAECLYRKAGNCVRRRGTTARPLKSDTLTAENSHPFRGSYS